MTPTKKNIVDLGFADTAGSSTASNAVHEDETALANPVTSPMPSACPKLDSPHASTSATIKIPEPISQDYGSQQVTARALSASSSSTTLPSTPGHDRRQTSGTHKKVFAQQRVKALNERDIHYEPVTTAVGTPGQNTSTPKILRPFGTTKLWSSEQFESSPNSEASPGVETALLPGSQRVFPRYTEQTPPCTRSVAPLLFHSPNVPSRFTPQHIETPQSKQTNPPISSAEQQQRESQPTDNITTTITSFPYHHDVSYPAGYDPSVAGPTSSQMLHGLSSSRLFPSAPEQFPHRSKTRVPSCRLTPPKRSVSDHTLSLLPPEDAQQCSPSLRQPSSVSTYGDTPGALNHHENLLQLQRAEFNACAAQRDKEIELLRLQSEKHQQQQAFASENARKTSFSFLPETNMGELRLLVEGKDQELKVLRERLRESETLRTQLLQHLTAAKRLYGHEGQRAEELNALRRRVSYLDHIRRQADILAATRQQQYQTVLQDLAERESLIEWYKQVYPYERPPHINSVCKTGIQLAYLESEAVRMRREIEDLNFEKQELQQLLIQKEKQLAALCDVGNPDSPEASALHLGAKAIAMVQDATQYNKKIRHLEEQLTTSQNELEKSREREDELLKKLVEKRHEAATLIQTLAAKDFRIAENETLLHQKTIEINKQAERQHAALSREQEKVGRLEHEVEIAAQQQTQLHEELARRDELILTLKSEIIRQSKYNQTAEARILTLTDELANTQQALQLSNQHRVDGDKLVYNLKRHSDKNDGLKQEGYANKDKASQRQLPCASTNKQTLKRQATSTGKTEGIRVSRPSTQTRIPQTPSATMTMREKQSSAETHNPQSHTRHEPPDYALNNV